MIMFISVPFDAEKSIIHSLRQNAVIFHHNVVNFQPQLHKNFSTKFFITSKQKYDKISTLNVVNFQSETWWFLYKKNEVIFLHKKQEIPNSKIGKRYIAECGDCSIEIVEYFELKMLYLCGTERSRFSEGNVEQGMFLPTHNAAKQTICDIYNTMLREACWAPVLPRVYSKHAL